MKSNYRRLGDYIQELKVRNTEEKAEQLLGINIDKFFMPSVANVVGTDLSVYKLVRKNQFACNRMHVGRDYRLPISMSKSDEEFMVSPAYDVFEIKDTEILNPEFLMMWFTRREFDRNAWFYTDADVRGGLPWKSFCDMILPIPHPDKQKEIVKEYNVIQNRIALNQQLIQKLEETAQSIYKQWFVEFEFPDENGKPYKSNGGEMIWNEELQKEIPKGWENKSIFEVSSVTYGFPFNSELFCQDETLKPLIRIRDILSNVSETFTNENVDEKYLIKNGDILIGMDGVFHISLWFGGKAYQNQRIVRLRNDKGNNVALLQLYFSIYPPIKELESTIEGTTVAHLSDKDMKALKVLMANDVVQEKAFKILESISANMITVSGENIILQKMKNLLLSRLATIEN
jgi:type I restriction enzyme S subunit